MAVHRSRMMFAVAALSTLWMGAVFAQGGAPQTPPPAGQAAPAGRGQGAAGGQAPAPGGQQGGRRGGFTQFTRDLPAADVIARGKALYDTNCASCHAPDLRGGAKGTNLLRSGTIHNDKNAELLATAVKAHVPPFNFVTSDVVAMESYIYSIQATMGGQGSPPGRNPTNVDLNVLVGDAAAGEKAFGTLCSTCHSISGDLKGIGGKFPDPRALQNGWVAGVSGRFGGAGGGATQATVTMPDGSKVQGALIRRTDWLVTLLMSDGTRRTIPRNPATGLPKVDVKDPQEAHKKMVLALDDKTNKKMYDITAYLWSIK